MYSFSESYGFFRTAGDALPAMDAFVIAHLPDIHFAGTDTGIAMGAFCPVHFHTEEGDGIEKGIDRA